MKITNEISLDLARDTMPITLFAKQYDNDTREILITPLDRGQAYTLEDGVTARLQIKKPDGNQVIKNCVIAGGKISAELSSQALATAGVATAEIGLYKDEKLLTSQSFYIDIKPAAYDAEQGGGGESSINVVQETGDSAEDVMSQKAVTNELKKLETSIDDNKVTIVQETGESTTDVMSQKAVTDALDKHKGVTVVQETGTSEENVMSQKAVTDALEKHKGVTVMQETGTSEENVMSQKAVTDAISENGKGFVKKEGDEMTGALTAPTFKGNLEGNATTSTYQKGFESGDLDKVVSFLEANSGYPFNEVFCWTAPANTKSPVPLEANDARRIFGCVAPGNVLNVFIEGQFFQSASLKNNSIGYALLSTNDRQDTYIQGSNYYKFYPVKVINELFNKCQTKYEKGDFWHQPMGEIEKFSINVRFTAIDDKYSFLKATMYFYVSCKPTGEEDYKDYEKVYDVTFFPYMTGASNNGVAIINGAICHKTTGSNGAGDYEEVTYTTGESTLNITRQGDNFDVNYTLNVKGVQGSERYQIVYTSSN